MPDRVNPRPYRSPLRARRAEETRAAILDAAQRLFPERGYVGTRLVDVAAEAGVSLPTVKLVFGTKKDLLMSLWHRTLAGGVDDQVPVADRPWMRAVFEFDDPAEKLCQLARNGAMVRTRIAALWRVIDTAAAVDGEIERLRATMLGEFHANMRGVVEHMYAAGMLRAELTVDEATDVLWTVNSLHVYFLLVHERGWTPDRYMHWLSRVLQRELLPEAAQRPTWV